MKHEYTLETPCFVINQRIMDSLIDELKEALDNINSKGIVGYSFKTNNTPWIISYMKKRGFYAEVVSSDEFHLARQIGFDFNEIIFNGPAKRKEEFIEAIHSGSIVNIDSKRELNWLLECDKEKIVASKIGLRVNFCIEDYCKGESQCGMEDGRFGFSYEQGELKEAINFFKENNIKLSGLHLHVSSKTRSLNIYNAIAFMAKKIVKEYELKLDYLDVGGGFFGGVTGKPKFKDYFNSIINILKEEPLLKNVKLVVEPGMSVIGASMDYVTEVIDTKKTKNNYFALLNGSRIHIDPLMRKTNYSYEIIRKNNSYSQKHSQILCGFTCMEGDRFFQLKEEDVCLGDHIIFKKVGAYSIGLSPQFIEFHPNIYFLDEGYQLMLVQKRKTAKDFIK